LFTFKNAAIHLTCYSLEFTGIEEKFQNLKITESYFSHNVAALTLERYVRLPNVVVVPPPNLMSGYVKASPAVYTQKEVTEKRMTSGDERTLSSSSHWTPYLEAGLKMYIGYGSSVEGFYWATVSTGYIFGGENLHNIARFGDGFFVNFDFAFGYFRPKYNANVDRIVNLQPLRFKNIPF